MNEIVEKIEGLSVWDKASQTLNDFDSALVFFKEKQALQDRKKELEMQVRFLDWVLL